MSAWTGIGDLLQPPEPRQAVGDLVAQGGPAGAGVGAQRREGSGRAVELIGPGGTARADQQRFDDEVVVGQSEGQRALQRRQGIGAALGAERELASDQVEAEPRARPGAR